MIENEFIDFINFRRQVIDCEFERRRFIFCRNFYDDRVRVHVIPLGSYSQTFLQKFSTIFVTFLAECLFHVRPSDFYSLFKLKRVMGALIMT